MPSYSGRTLYPSDSAGLCRCGLSKGAHKPSEAYYGEYRLEGRRSSSTALRWKGCSGYRESGLTLGEARKLSRCMMRWRQCLKGA